MPTLKTAFSSVGVAACVLLFACDHSSATKSYAVIAVAPQSINFGNLSPGQIAQAVVTVTSSGTSSLTLTSVSVTGDARGAFSLSGTIPTALASGSTAALTLIYTAPAAPGPDGAALEIDSNADNAPQLLVSLSGSSACSDCFDAGGTTDAGDGGTPRDAGTPDAGTPDAGTPCAACSANATCGDGGAGCVCNPGYTGDGVTCVATCDARWSLLAPAVSPTARYGHGLAYDAERKVTVLFGGFGLPTGQLQETWVWDGGTWSQLTPAARPSPRRYIALAYDSARAKTVLFSGDAPTSFVDGGVHGVFYPADTWEWDGTTWADRTPDAGPSPSVRYGYGLAYDAARQRTVLFGGESPDGTGQPMADTWEWDGTEWTQRTPVQSPPPLADVTLAYDSSRQRTVLFGGIDGVGAAVKETWEWDGTTWAHRAPAHAPSARHSLGIGYDSARQRMVMFGSTSVPADTWEYDGSDWTRCQPAVQPEARFMTPLAYDSARGRIVVFGGDGFNANVLGDTAEYGP